jgi:hypothetical protein
MVLVVLGLAGQASPAWAHGGIDRAGFSNYESTISSVTPQPSGLKVTTFGVGGGIKIVNDSTFEVVVLGYNNEPYLRLDSTGTFVNLNSPAAYVNGRQDANVPVPEKARTSDKPDWYQLSYGNTVYWHDHRAHWMGSTRPDVVLADPDHRQVVYPAWQIPIVVAGETGTITGTLTWVPAPKRTSWLLITLAVFVGAVLLLQFFRSVKSFAGLAVLGGLVANLIVAASRATAERVTSGQRIACFITTGVTLLLFVTGLVTKRRSGTPVAWGLAGGVLLGTGIAYLKAFSYASIDGSADPMRIRWAVVVQLAIGCALAVTALVAFVERRMLRRPGPSVEREPEPVAAEALSIDPFVDRTPSGSASGPSTSA